MLSELRVENLLLIERAELALAPGLNVLTGETGAGKTVLAHALDLLLGGRARTTVVRPGAPEAYVEGTFELEAGLGGEVGERLPAGAQEVVLARRVAPDGRTRAYVNGRTVNVGDLRGLAEGLLTFYGQHEHRKLTLAAAQMNVLDAFCGSGQARSRQACAAAYRQVHGLEGRVEELDERAGVRDREVDLLDFELAEIEQASPEEEEHRTLLARRERLRSLEALRTATGAAAARLTGEQHDTPGAAEQLAGAVRALDPLAGVDVELDALAQRLQALVLEAGDVASEINRYGERLEEEPGGLQAVEERLAVLERLMRKHGGTIGTVLEHADRCRARRAELLGAQVAIEEARGQLQEARAQLRECAQELRRARSQSAPRLAMAVRERLADLAMADATFEVVLGERPPGPTGADSAEFTIAPNPGVSAGPLREIASGGELSRVMLALTGVASADSETTLVFDEVDAGIGGQTARAVGEQLRRLADRRQVLCITHLPQIASLAARHFSVIKDTSAQPTRTAVVRLGDSEVVSELMRMLGAGEDDVGARRHARELLRAA